MNGSEANGAFGEMQMADLIEMEVVLGPEAETELTHEQVARLDDLMATEVVIHKKAEFAGWRLETIATSLLHFLKVLNGFMKFYGVRCNAVFLVGGAATNVVAPSYAFSDFDITFEVCGEVSQVFEKVLSAVVKTLRTLHDSGRPDADWNSGDVFEKVYFAKKFRLDNSAVDGEKWSVIGLHNDDGKSLELKFVVKIGRCYEFSADSLQIDLAPYIETLPPGSPVIVRSVYGNVDEAIHHAQNCLIETRNPGRIRLGGLLKYCLRKVKGFIDVREGAELTKLISEMVSRFFIDYVEITLDPARQDPISSWLFNHFEVERTGEENNKERKEILELKRKFIRKVAQVVEMSKVDKYQDHRRILLDELDSQIQLFSSQIDDINIKFDEENFPVLG